MNDIPSVGQYTNGRIASRNAQIPLSSDDGMQYMTLSELRQFVFEGYTPEGLAQLTELINELRQASDQIAEQLTEKAGAAELSTLLNTMLQSYTQLTLEIEIEFEQLRQVQSEHDSELTELSNLQSQYLETVTTLTEQVNVLTNTFSNYSNSLVQFSQTLGQLNDTVTNNSNSIAQLQNAVSANSITVNQLRTDLETTSGELAALQDGMTDDAETISQLQTGVTENANSISQLQQTVTENNSSIEQLQTNLNTYMDAIDTLQSSVTANTSAITTANQNIATLTKQMNREIALEYRPITAVAPYNFIHTTSPTSTTASSSVLSGRVRLSIIKIPKDILVDRFLNRVTNGLTTVNTHCVLYTVGNGTFADKLWAYSPLVGFPSNGNVLNTVQMSTFAQAQNTANGLPTDTIPAGTYWIGIYAKNSNSANFTFYTAAMASEYGLTSLGASQTVSGLEYQVGVAEVPPDLTTLVPGQISLGAIKMGFRVTGVLS